MIKICDAREEKTVFGLPVSTFLWVVAVPLAGLVMSVLYGLFYKNDDKWFTVEDLFTRGKSGNEVNVNDK